MMFADMPSQPLEAVAWLRVRIDHVDRETAGTRQRLDASTDPAERNALDHELMVGLWTRATALERASELMIELAPAHRATLEEQIESARAAQQVARQHLWGDPSQN